MPVCRVGGAVCCAGSIEEVAAHEWAAHRFGQSPAERAQTAARGRDKHSRVVGHNDEYTVVFRQLKGERREIQRSSARHHYG